MDYDLSLIRFAEAERGTISVLRDRLAMWILGFVVDKDSISRQGLEDSLHIRNIESFNIGVPAKSLYHNFV